MKKANRDEVKCEKLDQFREIGRYHRSLEAQRLYDETGDKSARACAKV